MLELCGTLDLSSCSVYILTVIVYLAAIRLINLSFCICFGEGGINSVPQAVCHLYCWESFVIVMCTGFGLSVRVCFVLSGWKSSGEQSVSGV